MKTSLLLSVLCVLTACAPLSSETPLPETWLSVASRLDGGKSLVLGVHTSYADCNAFVIEAKKQAVEIHHADLSVVSVYCRMAK